MPTFGKKENRIKLGQEIYIPPYLILHEETPEGYSSILWKDSSRVKEAAEKMKLTAEDLYELQVIDKIIKEPLEMKEEEFIQVAKQIKKEIESKLSILSKMTKEEIVQTRYEKFRNIKGYRIRQEEKIGENQQKGRKRCY